MSDAAPVVEVVIDVNVFITALTPGDSEQRECRQFLDRAHVHQDAGRLIVRAPPLFVLELFSVHNRVAENKKLDVSLYPRFLLTDTTTPLSTTIEPFSEEDAHAVMKALASAFPVQSPKGAKRFPLVRGGDLEFLAVARKFRCPLVTTDPGLLGYGRIGFATIIRPASWPPAS